MKKLLLLLPMLLTLTACNNDLQSKVENCYKTYYSMEIVQIDKISESDDVSLWFIAGRKAITENHSTITMGNYTYNVHYDRMRIVWEVYEEIYKW